MTITTDRRITAERVEAGVNTYSCLALPTREMTLEQDIRQVVTDIERGTLRGLGAERAISKIVARETDTLVRAIEDAVRR